MNRRARLESALQSLWFGSSGHRVRGGTWHALAATALHPLSAVVASVARRKRARIRALPPPPVPVVIVGNLVVGGAGKTPLVLAIASQLLRRGWNVGILCSGYGARRSDARLVGPDDDPAEHGDEAVLLARESGRPVAAGRERGQALALLLAQHPELQAVISDDGLQRPDLPRTVELAVFDHRGAGNGHLLPAGPLREPLAHLAGMDAVLFNIGDGVPAPVQVPAALPVFRFTLKPVGFVPVTGGDTLGVQEFVQRVHSSPAAQGVAAIAGIGAPQRFFDTLTNLGLRPQREVKPGDHAALDSSILQELTEPFIVMTTKDAVKSRGWADRRCWVLQVQALADPSLFEWLDQTLREASRGSPTARHPGMPGLQGTIETPTGAG